jgi:hypothetical protein
MINSQFDRERLLQYCAWAQQVIDVGVAFPVDNHTVEYWFTLTLQPLPEENVDYAVVL